jgi:hypothetical protein
LVDIVVDVKAPQVTVPVPALILLLLVDIPLLAVIKPETFNGIDTLVHPSVEIFPTFTAVVEVDNTPTFDNVFE